MPNIHFDPQTYERFSHVAMILGKMVIALAKEQSARLLKHVIRCYLRLSDNPRWGNVWFGSMKL